MKDVFRNLNKDLVPNDNTLNVAVSFYLVNLVSVKEIEETIEIIASLRLSWNDQTVFWAPPMYGNITSMYLRVNNVWAPKIGLLNPAVNFKPIDGNKEFFAEIFYNGTIVNTPDDIFIASCAMDTSMFPYDTQKCTLTLGPNGVPELHIHTIIFLQILHGNWFQLHLQFLFLGARRFTV